MYQNVVTSTLSMKQPLAINDVIKLSLFAKEFKGTITIYDKKKSVNLKYLPMVMSFFLTSKSYELEVMVVGQDPQLALRKIRAILSSKQKNIMPQFITAVEKV